MRLSFPHSQGAASHTSLVRFYIRGSCRGELIWIICRSKKQSASIILSEVYRVCICLSVIFYFFIFYFLQHHTLYSLSTRLFRRRRMSNYNVRLQGTLTSCSIRENVFRIALVFIFIFSLFSFVYLHVLCERVRTLTRWVLRYRVQ